MQAVSSLHFKLDVTGGAMAMGQFGVLNAEGDLAKPDRMQLKTQTQFAGGSAELGILSSGGKQYMTNPFTGRWLEIPGGLSAVALFDPATGVPSLIKGAKDIRKLDPETVDGVRCFKVEGSLASDEMVAMLGPQVAGRTLKATAWFGMDDFLMRQLRLEGPLAENEPPAISRLLTLSRFNQPVTIEGP